MINLPDFDEKSFINKACDFIECMVVDANCKGVVLGLSGGIDSAVVSYLAVKALGSSNVYAYILPSDTTSQQDLDDAILVKEKLGINGEIISIEDFYTNFIRLCDSENLTDNNKTLASANVKPRIRMMILYYYATIHNCLVVGTGNKTELSVGYFTKHGDGGVDLLPIGSLYKEEVIKVAKALKIPKSIIEKPPTAGLLPDQTDEKELGISYPLLDRLLYLYLEEKMDSKSISKELDVPLSDVERIIKLYKNSEHKRNVIPILEK